ncbi:MAG: hypothetical protein LKE39_11195 [Sphaerochaeta sp.]|jgi:hypothetical protein|nr:hypothetical protein [Sphaerochaeta sp.]MCH3921003.1 hypothetical protein [Sphaerochaeta sp.]MCI2045258.1 hypothetical protein [Sphaerochaeta sp.]MCI2075885.1 hypothetical protein [Sphaerochaeta sp.]
MEKNEKELKENIELIIKNTDMFTEEDADRLTEQVKGHKYFLDRQLGRDLSWTEVAFSWMENVYLPISEAMETFTTSASFPGQKRDDVFFELCDHWFYMAKDGKKHDNAFDVALDYDANYGKSIGKWLAKMQCAHIA